MRKFNLRYYVLLLIALLISLLKPSPLSSILLFLVAGIAYWLLEMRQKTELVEKETDLLSEKKEADVRADEAYDRLIQLINAIPSPLTYINQKGDFEVSNIYFKQMIEIPAEHVYDVAIDSPLRQIMLDAFLNEKQFIRQFTYHQSDFQVHSIPIFNEEKRYNGCMLVFQDVTRVTEGEKLQKRFIADASHELRTPITSILGMIEILNQDNFNDEQVKTEFLEQIEKESHRLKQIVDDLLLQSRLKADMVYLEKQVFNLRQFFEGVIYEKRLALHEQNIEVVLNCPSNIEIYADQFRLSQVFTNLLNNSINYTENGNIRIDVECWQETCTIRFSDDGEGIPEEILPHIFDRFFKGRKDRNASSTGSGLGLAISKSIIEAHGGTIEVESEKGKGTTFTIVLTEH